MSRVIRRPGNLVNFDFELDRPVIDAENGAELRWHLENAQSAGFINKPGTHTYDLKAKGWDYLLGPSGGGAIPGRCFVAMSFSEEHSAIYTEGIRPAVEDAGYHPIWMKDVLTNEDIYHRMAVEIRQAQFVVADFTGQKGGVYFEAGFALALGRPVFWTTEAKEMQRVHFDTNHYQHIAWETPSDLRRQLTCSSQNLI
jgi:nucleoside 2-deoxyribosyltransferase